MAGARIEQFMSTAEYRQLDTKETILFIIFTVLDTMQRAILENGILEKHQVVSLDYCHAIIVAVSWKSIEVHRNKIANAFGRTIVSSSLRMAKSYNRTHFQILHDHRKQKEYPYEDV